LGSRKAERTRVLGQWGRETVAQKLFALGIWCGICRGIPLTLGANEGWLQQLRGAECEGEFLRMKLRPFAQELLLFLMHV
jgi:hypothetical protein